MSRIVFLQEEQAMHSQPERDVMERRTHVRHPGGFSQKRDDPALPHSITVTFAG
jgi:hypothetical protein